MNEPRTGGRLRLNSLCGLNLASHALSCKYRLFRWLYEDPEYTISEDLEHLVSGKDSKEIHRDLVRGTIQPNQTTGDHSFKGYRIGVIGTHPDGFTSCQYDQNVLANRFATEIFSIELNN